MHRMSITTRRALAEQDVLTGRNVATAEETVSNRMLRSRGRMTQPRFRELTIVSREGPAGIAAAIQK